jgi:hypothetical protein
LGVIQLHPCMSSISSAWCRPRRARQLIERWRVCAWRVHCLWDMAASFPGAPLAPAW